MLKLNWQLTLLLMEIHTSTKNIQYCGQMGRSYESRIFFKNRCMGNNLSAILKTLMHSPPELNLTQQQYNHVQGISRLKAIINHTYHNITLQQGIFTKNLQNYYSSNLGLSMNFQDLDYSRLHHLVTDSLVKSSRHFLQHNNLHLLHDMKFPHQRQEDCSLNGCLCSTEYYHS